MKVGSPIWESDATHWRVAVPEEREKSAHTNAEWKKI